ncbi:homoserine O-acetyltransferase [Litoribacter ruber]|uniref:Homoserine O-acetyltransferase n=1 Tax=Litoribacter ruber TaxID=702568 RepID=A0AAP2G5J8_9BACT|nr:MULTISPECIES: homoserine O-acetyltransferase [Litoribacter]MBS9525171.1 homoserine O-acetyltransferase [Litoribacter alkaliphilus]MBT0811657.1 homoserine O-acetyltransferase [Litoribacter ruber]
MNLNSPLLEIEDKSRVFHYEDRYLLESGEDLAGFQIAYTIYGNPEALDSHVIWINHALTGNADVHEWWSGLVGEDKFYDPKQYKIICTNLLGSCYGSTNPLSSNPETGKPYFYQFPQLTTRDMAGALEKLREHLGVEHIHTLVGGSLGGQVALEWTYQLGSRLDYSIIIAANAKSTPWIRGFNEAQRMAIQADCTWGEEIAEAGKSGLRAARAIGMLTYRHPDTFQQSQDDMEEKLDNYKVSSYLQYQGKKLADRFHALSYWVLTKAMDSHDLGRGRGGTERALQGIKAKMLTVGIDTDQLFRKEESQYISENCLDGKYSEISSSYGHDAFLIEYEQLHYILKSFYLYTENGK